MMFNHEILRHRRHQGRSQFRDDEHRGHGRLVLRYSGTELLAHVTVESDDEGLTGELVEQRASAIQEHMGER